MGRTTRRFPKAFAERNRVVIAVIGIVALVGGFLATFNADDLPVVGGGEQYQAYFRESAGLRSGDEVRVAGVKVGKVTAVDLDRDRVLVSFRAKGVDLGDQTAAAIKIRTTLGQKYLAVDPLGRGDLAGPIPDERTTEPYDVNAALSDLSSTVGEIDTARLEESFRTLADVFADTPAAVRGTVDGLTRLSKTIASRDDELAGLFDATAGVTGTLASRDEEIGRLIDDGDLLLTELAQRREAIRQMLRSTVRLGEQVSGLVRDNQRRLRPALDKLDRVATILRRNQDHLDDALEALGPYYRQLAAATGNGRWVDSYLCGLFDDQDLPVLDDDVVRDCRPGGKR